LSAVPGFKELKASYFLKYSPFSITWAKYKISCLIRSFLYIQ